MPGSNTGHLPQTLVSLPGKLLCVHSTLLTFEATTPGDSNDVNHLILVEDGRDRHSLLQALLSPVHLVRDASPVYEILVQLFLSCLILPLLTVLGEGLLLALVPKTQKYPVRQQLKDGFEGTQATDSLNVSHYPHHNDWRSVNDGNRLYFLSLFVHTEASAVHFPQCVGHASLVSQEGSEVDRMAGVIFRPCAHLAPMLLATLVGQEPHVSMAGCVEFTMRLERHKPHSHSHFLFT
uniref:Uncharacterized protein n=1 Tax=Sander lucioperca TaxID=283035 RepID=A0A8C9Z575_SANLU